MAHVADGGTIVNAAFDGTIPNGATLNASTISGDSGFGLSGAASQYVESFAAA